MSLTKSDLMLRYEAETGKPSINVITDGVHTVGLEVWHYEFISWLEKHFSKEELNSTIDDTQRMTPAQEHAYKKETL